MKRLITIFLCLAILLTTTACGASKSSTELVASSAPAARNDMAVPQEAPAPEAFTSDSKAENGALAGSTAVRPTGERKIIKNMSVMMESREYDQALKEILAMITELGGYVESSNENGNSLYREPNISRRYSYITARIPADKLGSASGKLSEIGNITSKQENSSDITDVYYDVEARLKSLSIQEERYLELLKKADKMEDIISLENALTNVRYEIESLTTQQRRYDQQVSYSSLTIELQEVGDYSVVRNQPLSFGQRISNALSDSLLFISRSAQDLVVFLVSILPVALVYGAVIAIIVLIILKLTKRGRPFKKPTPPPSEPEVK